MHQHPGLAAAGSGDHQRIAKRRHYGFTLRVIQPVEDMSNVVVQE